MKFRIERTSFNIKKPHPKAQFVGFDDANTKHYTIEVNTLEELLDILKYNDTDISIFSPYPNDEDELYTISVNDA